ncbi:MAG: hypothetical protein ACKO33_01035 [Bacteroidota bacterium]
MKHKIIIPLLFAISMLAGCGKDSPAPSDPCQGVSITVTGSTSNPSGTSANGNIIATASGGTGPYTYSLNGGSYQATGQFANLAAGSYTITAKSAAGCTGNATFTLGNSDPCQGVTITVTGNTVNPSGTSANGSITANAAGGTGPYTYSLNGGPFQATGQFANLAAGSYTITAKSAAGCTGNATFTLTATAPCTGVIITITPTVTGTTPCVTASGLIAISANGGSSPYTYNLNNGAYQSGSTFQGLNNGTYQIGVKDANGCTATLTGIAVASRTEGPKFTAVKALIQANCVSCHNATNASGGVNLSTDCSIVSAKDRIKARAVDGLPSPMPSSGLLPASERQKITDWITAGGRVID